LTQLLAEISIHRSVIHKHIVRFHHVGSNAENYYLLLEKCNNKSLRQVVKARSRLTEEEVKYWMSQLLDGLAYLHANNICHRDLKLDNIFLHDMQVKLGDFGFSVKLLPNETTRTFCGTPNYIAPEVVARVGYSLPVDVWAVGVLIYTMLYGTPPFETAAAETTYAKITNNDYSFPVNDTVSEAAREVITWCLQHVPTDRPTCNQLLAHRFFAPDTIPSSLHPSSLGYSLPPIPNIVPANRTKRQRAAAIATTENHMDQFAPVAKRFAVPDQNKENAGNIVAVPASHRGIHSTANGTSGNVPVTATVTSYNSTTARNTAEMQPPSHTTRLLRSASAHQNQHITTITTSSAQNQRTTLAQQTMEEDANFIPSHSASSTPTKLVAAPWDQSLHEKTLNRIVARLTEISSVPAITELPKVPPPSVTPHDAHQLGHHWIVKWVDYSQRFGLGFQFCNNVLGVLYTDRTSLLSKSDSPYVTYSKFVNAPSATSSGANAPEGSNAVAVTSGTSSAFSSPSKPINWILEEFHLEKHASVIQQREHVRNRMKLLEYFADYMKMKLVASSGLSMVCDNHCADSPPLGVLRWVKTEKAIGFLFTNYTVQINFYDHVKLVMTLPDTVANPNAVELITIVNEKGSGSTRTAKQLMEGGVMTNSLIAKLHFAANLIATEFMVCP
jgi:serine/threonine protein kinase